ncbi:MAG: histidine kinase [Xenococcaceae cyanobacterium MO_207.B15]|nr:histidine kinase [Xenococcaceae cyanobacterium MO_207.B15]MDJ0743601.1 histidine kinase [Xenococcaceae cyanobacterium MO_167.B27]
MLQLYNNQEDYWQEVSGQNSLQLLLFVNERPTSQENTRQIRVFLENLKATNNFKLDVIDIGKQPHLVEYFKLIATPALVKISPSPQQTLAGSNLISQLEEWWPRWQASLKKQSDNNSHNTGKSKPLSSSSRTNPVQYSEELIRLSDEIFSLQREKEELSEQLKFKDQILAMLAHDLRSPLTAASLAMETLELSETQKDKAQRGELRNQLYEQSRRQFGIMKRMIGDLLEASRSVSAKLEVEPRKMDLKHLCQDAIALMSKQLKAKSQTLTKDIPQDIPSVYVDEELVRQLLVNLLDNAIKYTPEGGQISLSVLHRTSQKVQVSVCDTGPGIPPEKQEHIFEGHFRLKRDEEQEGYGLGLSLCRKIARAHYGQIWVDSSPNRGSCFHFTLPVYRS